MIDTEQQKVKTYWFLLNKRLIQTENVKNMSKFIPAFVNKIFCEVETVLDKQTAWKKMDHL